MPFSRSHPIVPRQYRQDRIVPKSTCCILLLIRARNPAQIPNMSSLTVKDIPHLFLATQLALKAQQVRKLPIPDTFSRLTRTRLPTGLAPGHAAMLTHKACAIIGRMGFLNTCIIKSLVLGSLLSDHENLEMRIGFKASSKPTASTPEGHAWIVLKGQNVFDQEEGNSLSEFTEVISIPLRRQ